MLVEIGEKDGDGERTRLQWSTPLEPWIQITRVT